MNGARSTYMRKGYLLTALAAAVMLAASSGTAYAQKITATENFGEGGVKVEVPKTVAEGNSATITISASAAVDVDTLLAQRTVTVTLKLNEAEDTPGSAEDEDALFNPSGVVALVFPVNPKPATGAGEAKTSVVTRTISLQTTHDPDAEDEKVGMTASATGGLKPILEPEMITIEDDETQTYVLTVTTKEPKEAAAINVSLRADPAHEDGSVELTLHSSDPKYTVNVDAAIPAVNTATIDGDTLQGGEPIVVTPPTNDGNRVEDSVTLTAHSGSVGNSMERTSVTIKVADANVLPAVAAKVVDKGGKALDPQPTSVTEGESIYVAVMAVDKDGKADTFGEKLTVALTPTGTAGSADYTLVRSIEIGVNAKASDAVELEVRADEDVGMESLMFDATVSGDSKTGTETSTSAGVLSLTIEDATAKRIEPKSADEATAVVEAAMKAGGGDEGLNPGESFEVKTVDLFKVAAGYTASYGASVSGDAVGVSTTGDSVTVTANSAGESKVTVTGTAKAAMSSAMPSQTVSNVAEVSFDVTVVDRKLVVTLEAPAGVMNGNIVEGKSYDIKVTANRAVTESEGSVEVTIMRDRAASDAGDDDFTVSSATIMAGKDSATAELMVKEDNDPDAGHADGEVLVLYGMVGDEETNALTFTIWDEAVPALPLIGQLLLALFLMAGGARLYRRRQG